MELNSVISNLNHTLTMGAAQREKTAQVSPAQGPSKVDAALASAYAAVGQEKTASAAPTPVSDLVKLAEEVRANDEKSEEQHTFKLGRAFGAGFVHELNDSDEIAKGLLAKQASDVSDEDRALIKMAREEPAKFLSEVQRGYVDGLTQTKEGQEMLYKHSFDETIDGIHKAASAHYIDGYKSADALIRLASEQK